MKIITSVFFALGLALTSLAQSPSKVLKQAEKALGGSKALQSVRSVAKTGRITRLSDGAAGGYVYQASQPNLLNVSFDLNGFETENGYNGRSGWARNSRDGLQTLTGASSINMQAAAAFRNNLWLNAKNDKSRLVSAGQSAIDGKTANTVILTTPKGVTVKIYFDALSGLPVRDEISDGGISETCAYGDYRDVSGTKQAFFNRVKLGGETYEIKLDDVKINPQIARAEFDFPNLSGQALPDIPSLLKDLQANEDRVEALLDHYSFTQKTIHRELGKDGLLREKESETYQISFYKGNRMWRLIEKNGKPLTEKEQADQDKDAGKRVGEIEKKVTKREANPDSQSDQSRRVSFAEMLRASTLLNPRREHFRGRDVIVFDFEPNPSFDPKNAKSMIRLFGKMAGVIWVDAQDKQVARMEAVLADNVSIVSGALAKLKKGGTFAFEKERFNDEIWLPSQSDINVSLRVLLVKGIDLNQVVKSYDYRKFETEVKGAKVDETKKP